MAALSEKRVELGFLEKSEPFLLQSRFFPSKFGGRPAWLSLKNLPVLEELTCPQCSNPTTFLLQLYCPDSEREETFHRTILIFVCKSAECSNRNSLDNFHVFRSQLPKINEFYSTEPPVERSLEKEIDASLYNSLCVVCGCLATKSCGSCHKVHYCSKPHQKIDWKAGHKQLCAKETSKEVLRQVDHSFLFTEMELVTEEEQFDESSDEEDDNTAETTKVLDSSQKNKKGLSASELEQMAYTETEADRQLIKFKKRLASDPDQVLRYSRGGEPLLIAPEPVPSDIPDCSCGAKRQFEFQILPQLLSHMGVDKLGASLDWGVVCIYTCRDSCDIGNQYKREYVFKQDVS